MNKKKPIEHRDICGAKTRAGTPCKRSPRPNGRCNLHGGKSLSGLASPTFKHGRYSKHLPSRLSQRYEEAYSNDDFLNLRSEIALTDTRISDLIDKLEVGDIGDLWLKAQKAYDEMRVYMAEQDAKKTREKLTLLGSIIEQGANDQHTWRSINNTWMKNTE